MSKDPRSRDGTAGNELDQSDANRRRILKIAGSVGVGAFGLVGSATAADDEGELVKDGIDEFVSDNSKTPDWYTIGKDDELLHRPEGIRRTQEGLCAGGTVKAFGYEIGLNLCHYGGCNGKLEGCYIICVSENFDDCDGSFQISVGDSTSPIDATFTVDHELFGDTLSADIEGEVCRYDPWEGRECLSADTTISV